MAKITKATFKAFLRKNAGKVLIRVDGAFDGMTDCRQETGQKEFVPIQNAVYPHEENLGYAGVWLVGGSRNSFSHYEKDGLVGIEVWNCCRDFVVAVPKTATRSYNRKAAEATMMGA